MELSLLYPEWQGYGENTDVYTGALKIVETIFNDREFLRIEVPSQEALSTTKGILGLASIAPRFQKTLLELHERKPSKIFMVGGTCGVEVAPIDYLNERYNGDLAIVWLDAHGDLNTATSSPSGHFHGMALRTLLGDGPDEYITFLRRMLKPNQIFLVGSRQLDPSEETFIKEAGIAVTWPAECKKPQQLVNGIRNAGFRNLYIHLDLDVLNPESFPNSLMQTPGGPSLVEIRDLIRELSKSFNVVGFSVLEYCEHQEDKDMSSLKELICDCGITIAESNTAKQR